MVFSETIKAAMYSSEARADDEAEKVLGLGLQLLVGKKKKKKLRLHNDREIAGFEQKWVLGWAAGRAGHTELHAPRDISPFHGSCPAPA